MALIETYTSEESFEPPKDTNLKPGLLPPLPAPPVNERTYLSPLTLNTKLDRTQQQETTVITGVSELGGVSLLTENPMRNTLAIHPIPEQPQLSDDGLPYWTAV